MPPRARRPRRSITLKCWRRRMLYAQYSRPWCAGLYERLRVSLLDVDLCPTPTVVDSVPIGEYHQEIRSRLNRCGHFVVPGRLSFGVTQLGLRSRGIVKVE